MDGCVTAGRARWLQLGLPLRQDWDGTRACQAEALAKAGRVRLVCSRLAKVNHGALFYSVEDRGACKHIEGMVFELKGHLGEAAVLR